MVAIGCKLKYFGKNPFRKSWKDKRSWAKEYESDVRASTKNLELQQIIKS